MIEAAIPKVAQLLRSAAKTKSTLSYPSLFNCFAKETPKPDIYDTLEVAANTIVEMRVTNYTALLALKNTGLPGDGFFDAFLNFRPDDIRRIAGPEIVTSLDLTAEQKRTIVSEERDRVYKHAATSTMS
jgi:hypothetical protein